MKRHRLVSLQGYVTGKAWGGFKASLNIDKPLDRSVPLTQAVERIVKRQGDFEWCQISDDSAVVVTLYRVSGDRAWEYTRAFPVTKFPSIAKFVAAPSASPKAKP